MTKTKAMQLRLTPDLYDALQKKANEIGLSMSGIVSMYCQKQLNAEEYSQKIMSNIQEGIYNDQITDLLKKLQEQK